MKRKHAPPTCHACNQDMVLIRHVHRAKLGRWYWEWRCERQHAARYHYTRTVPAAFTIRGSLRIRNRVDDFSYTASYVYVAHNFGEAMAYVRLIRAFEMGSGEARVEVRDNTRNQCVRVPS